MNFLHENWQFICIVGIVVNIVFIIKAVDSEPEGGMGAIPLLVVGLIPYSTLILILLSKIIPMFGE